MGAANHLAQVATLAAAGDDMGFLAYRVQKDTVRLGTVHDAEPAPFFGDTLVFIYKRDVIH